MATKVGEIYAELTIDDSRFQSKMANADKGFTNLAVSARRAASDVDGSFSGSGARIERMGLGAKGAADDVRKIGTAADQAGRTVKTIDLPSGLADRANKAAEAVGRIGEKATGAASSGTAMGDSFVGGFASKIQGLGKAGGPIAAGLVGVAAIGLAAGAALMGAINDGMQQQKVLGLTQAKLGLDDETMARLGKAAGDAYVGNFGESVAANLDSATAAFDFNLIDADSTTADIQRVIEQTQTLADVLGTEVPDAMRGVGGLVNSGLAANVTEATDLILAARKNGLDAQGDLIDSISEYSSGWKNSGLSAKTALALVDQSMENGADNTDRASDAIREFGRRVTEEGGTIVGALDDIGLNGADMFEAFKRGGPDAEAAFDQAFDAIRAIEDPVERNNAAMALLGDTAGDFIGTLSNWDPSAAVAKFGNVAGATDEAVNSLGANAAGKLEAARRSIETSMSGVEVALANAFGPALGEVAEWVSAHQPEIIGFFTALADGALATLDACLAFASGALRAFADLQEQSGNLIGGTLEMLGTFGEKVGGLVKHIPGMEKLGEAMETGGSSTAWFGEQMNSAADKARGMADMIDTGRPKIDAMRESVRSAGAQAQNSAELTRAFGGTVEALPAGKDVLVKALTDEAKARLAEMGFKIETLPDGTTKVIADTAEGQAMIDDFVSDNNGRKITTYTVNQIIDQRNATGNLAGPVRMSDGTWRADGGVDIDKYADGHLPDHAEIKPATGRFIQWAEPETGGEAFIPLAMGKRTRSTAILAAVAKRFGMELTAMADGGIVDSITALGSEHAPGLTVTDSYRPGAADYHGAGQAVDFSNGSGNTAEQLAWANYLADNYRSQIAELIYDDPAFGRQIKNGEFVGNDFYAGAGDHTHHVHVAGQVPLLLPDQGSPADQARNPSAPQAPAVDNTDTMPSVAPTAPPAASSTSTMSGGVQDVRVTNWPGQGESTDERKPRATLTARMFADGTEDHTAQIANGGDMRVWAEPETEGEAYIPLAAAKRARSSSILQQVAKRFGFDLTPFALGGFGGLGANGSGGVHTGSWQLAAMGDQGDVPLSTPKHPVPLAIWAQNAYRAGAAASGLALTAASGFDSSGKFQGFNTGNTSIPGLDTLLEGVAETNEHLAQLVKGQQEGAPVDVQVDIDSGRRTAELAIKQFGV